MIQTRPDGRGSISNTFTEIPRPFAPGRSRHPDPGNVTQDLEASSRSPSIHIKTPRSRGRGGSARKTESGLRLRRSSKSGAQAGVAVLMPW
jgi:hypothetical protein